MDSNGKEMLRPVCGTVRSRRTVLLGRELRVPPRRVRHDGVRRTVAPRAVHGTEELHRNARTGHPAGGVVPRRTHKQHHDNTGRDDAHIERRTRRTRSRRTGVVPSSYPRRTRRRTLAIEAGPTTGLWGSPGSNPSRLSLVVVWHALQSLWRGRSCPHREV
jgi:hypothetical protein